MPRQVWFVLVAAAVGAVAWVGQRHTTVSWAARRAGVSPASWCRSRPALTGMDGSPCHSPVCCFRAGTPVQVAVPGLARAARQLAHVRARRFVGRVRAPETLAIPYEREGRSLRQRRGPHVTAARRSVDEHAAVDDDPTPHEHGPRAANDVTPLKGRV